MQDMSPTMPPVSERKKSEEELLLDLFAEVAMRAWLSARPKTPLTHRILEAMCKEAQHSLADTEALERSVVGMHDGADVDCMRPRRLQLLKCHNALWRRISAHAASARVSKMKPDGYVFNAKKLPGATHMRTAHGALYSCFRAAAKLSSS